MAKKWMRSFNIGPAQMALDDNCASNLTRAFVWKDTKEGYEYWSRVYLAGFDKKARKRLKKMIKHVRDSS